MSIAFLIFVTFDKCSHDDRKNEKKVFLILNILFDLFLFLWYYITLERYSALKKGEFYDYFGH